MWERHIKKYHIDEIEYVSFNLGDFGLARAADDLVHTFCWMPSKSVSLEELLGHGTLSRHPNEGNLHHRASDGLNLDWLQGVEAMCVFIFSCFMIKCKISAWNLSLDLFFFYHPMQKLASLSSSWSSSTNFWCWHQTVNFLFFFYDFLSVGLRSARCVWCFEDSVICHLSLFEHVTVDTRWWDEYYFHFPKVPPSPLLVLPVPLTHSNQW